MITYLLTIGVAVLLPIVPAWILYKLLPSTGSVTGPLKGMSIQLTGAFAGYLVVFLSLLGYMNLHPAPGYEVWKIKGQVVVEDDNAIHQTKILVIPPAAPRVEIGGIIETSTPIALMPTGRLTYPNLLIERPGFKTATIPLDKKEYVYAGNRYEILRDIRGKIIEIQPPIKLVPIDEN